MLNLRQISSTDYATQTEVYLSNFSAPRFRAEDSIFANLAEPLKSFEGEETSPQDEAEDGDGDAVDDSVRLRPFEEVGESAS